MPHQTAQYQAYSIATRTVGKTRQVVMLYDGVIRCLKQAEIAIAEKRIEERFKLLQRASEIILGLQNSIDFDKGGEVAMTLHRFYTGISVRILSVNFKKTEGQALCKSIIEELKQMRDVWDSIDRTLDAGKSPAENPAPPAQTAQPSSAAASGEANVSLSA